MVVLLVIVVLIILSLMFGGFQKGTKSGSLGQLHGPGRYAPEARWDGQPPLKRCVAGSNPARGA